MIIISVINNTISFLLTLFGLLLPSLSTMQTVMSRDADGVRELLTYWTVYSLLMYIPVLSTYEPILRLIIILWLTLPQTQGAFRLYVLLIKPYFALYEDDIDRHIGIIGENVKKKATKHVQAIAWQLFMAPNDGILSMAMVSSASRYFFNNNSSNDINNYKNSNDKSSISLSNELVKDFTAMLSEGILLLADDDSSEVTLKLLKCQLRNDKLYFYDVDDSSSNSSNNKNNNDSNGVELIVVPIISILSVASDVDDSSLMNLNLSNNRKGVYIKIDDDDLSNAFIRGLHMLILEIRTKAVRTLTRALKIATALRKTTHDAILLRHYFSRLKGPGVS